MGTLWGERRGGEREGGGFLAGFSGNSSVPISKCLFVAWLTLTEFEWPKDTGSHRANDILSNRSV